MTGEPSGWLPGVIRIETAAWGYSDIAPDGLYPKAVVNHVAQGFYTTLQSMMRSPDPGKSWHFAVSRKGEITQSVSIWNPAWHAGDVNTPTWRGYTGGNPNKSTIGIECEGFSISAPGVDYVYNTSKPWPDAMVESVIRIHRFVFDSCANWIGVPSEDNVITHSMLNSKSRAQDPGDLWLATVRPRIIAALLPAPPTPPAPTAPTYDTEGAKRDLRAAMDAAAAALIKLGG